MKFLTSCLIFTVAIIIVVSCHPELIIKVPPYDYSTMDKKTIAAHQKIEKFIFTCQQTKTPIAVHPSTRIDSLLIDSKLKRMDIKFSKHFSYIPFRQENVQAVYAALRKQLGRKYRDYHLTLWTLGEPLEELIPNFYRSDSATFDFRRKPQFPERMIQPIVRPNTDWIPQNGLYNRNIGLWHSHGWYYSNLKDRWEWQRPRLFQTVEDLLPMSFTIPYLIPMLENAGARVFIPRERDIQIHEVIVDNDSIRTEMGQYQETGRGGPFVWSAGSERGFAVGRPPYPLNFNPFRQGSYRLTTSDTLATAEIEWIPNIPESGYYAVYVSYHASAQNVDDALYTVYHRGGATQFLVNQQIGGDTWIYLGHFKFFTGMHPDSGKVTLVNKSEQAGRIITADAVRFGGGRGNILRNEKTSGRPRFVEAARYYLQYAGLPDTLVYNFNDNQNDYIDDYQCRAEYINYLQGAPAGPNKNRQAPGLGIPIDLSLAFHTDAGISRNDTTIGTLMIYSISDADTQTTFPDGMSRLANRDLGDILQTQISHDLRRTFDPQWNRRFLMESPYSEAFRPNVPGVLLELLSHQNFLDMRFAHDPRFKFVVSRAIYKGMLKFISHQYGSDFVVQPLPVTHFQATFDSFGNIQLQWQPSLDPLEPTSRAEKYRIYTRLGEGGFDNGVIVDQPYWLLTKPNPGIIYSFKVTALNSGGESFPSEILAICKMAEQVQPVLIVNGFDRICAAASLETSDLSGFANFRDEGVPDRFDLNFTGPQFDFDPQSAFRLNDAPGHGASYADFETRIIPGNSFDFPYVHGQAIQAAGYSFVSCSDEAMAEGLVDLGQYKVIDWILGEEKESSWPKSEMDSRLGKQFKTLTTEHQKVITEFVKKGGNLLLSGAYVGSDLFAGKPEKHPDKDWARNVLKIWWVTDHAVRHGRVLSTRDSLFKEPLEVTFNTQYHPYLYTVEAPDAIGPEEGARVILRYAENEFSAGIAYAGNYKTIVLGFPFETIVYETERRELMRIIMDFLNGKKRHNSKE